MWTDVVSAIATLVVAVVAVGVAIAEFFRFLASREAHDSLTMRQWQSEAAWLEARYDDTHFNVVITNRGPREFLRLNLMIEQISTGGVWVASHNERRERIAPGDQIVVPMWNEQSPMLSGRERPSDVDLRVDFDWRLCFSDNEERRWVRFSHAGIGPRMIKPTSETGDNLEFINKPPPFKAITAPGWWYTYRQKRWMRKMSKRAPNGAEVE
jgi:hypothetical protein